MSEANEAVSTPTNEVNNLFSGDAALDAELASMEKADFESAALEPEATATKATQSNTQAEPESNDDEPASGEQKEEASAEDEEVVEPYQHNKNYKQAMDEARREKAEIKKEFVKTREENEKLKQLYDRIIKTANEQQAKQNEPQIPAYEDDPIEHLRQRAEKAEKVLQEYSQDKQQSQQNLQQQQAIQQFLGTYHQETAKFQESTPDYKQAYDFIMKDKLNEYETLGYSKKEAMQMITEDEAAVAAKCLSAGINPAEKIYQFAKMRGYNKSQEQSNTQGIDKLATIERGQQAAKTLTQGMPKNGKLTLEAVAAMNDDELAKLDWKKVLELG